MNHFSTKNNNGRLAHKPLTLKVNGKLYQIPTTTPKTMRLTEFLRTVTRHSGVKMLCHEGGCGVCTVVATAPDLELGGTKTFSLQACQALVHGCVGWDIETIEHLGDRFRGYDVLQKTLHKFYGTQCGYCSPGMIMTMHGHHKSKGVFRADEVERLLDGNLCRCTGYRPIVDAFKSLAEDIPEYLKDREPDIEDLSELRPQGGGCKGGCTSCGRNNGQGCKTRTNSLITVAPVLLSVESGSWYMPNTLEGIYEALNKMSPGTKYRIVVGNTGQGVYKDDGPYNLFISTSYVRAFHSVSLDASSLVLGSSVTLARAIQAFEDASSRFEEFAHLRSLAKHWRVVANVGVRNVGCWAGNLMLKHAHRDFPSDVFLTLLSVGAQVTLGHAKNASTSIVSLEKFLDIDMHGKVILAVTLPPMPTHTTVRSFKITPRLVNAHAYVNACFRLRVDPEELRVLEPPVIAIGGISPDFIHAKDTEDLLKGRRLDEPDLISEATRTLAGELAPDSKPQDASPEYRTSLAVALLYKTLLGLIGPRANSKMLSGGEDLVRPSTYSHQDFVVDPSTPTLGQPMLKLESLFQVSGEAKFTNDINYHPDELHGYFVQSRIANARIKRIDPSEALKVKGVRTFLTAGDVPGDNFFTVFAGPSRDILFANDRVQYAGQALGLVVAETHEIAKEAARLVRVEYYDCRPPIIGIKAALANGNVRPEKTLKTGGDIEETLGKSKHVVTGQFHQGSQYHMCMEPHSARVVPTEDGYDVDAATQWPTETQAAIARALRVPTNQVHVKVRRLGGAFGAKISRGNVVATAAAVAAYRMRCPVRINLDLKTNMTIAGWRDPYYAEYKVGFDDSGRLNGIKMSLVNDIGCLDNENPMDFCSDYISGVYLCPTWDVTCRSVLTDTAPNTWVRAPGSVNMIAVIENLMDHVATHVGKDPLEVRELNIAPAGVSRFPRTFVQHEDVLQTQILPLIKEKAEYMERKAYTEAFNKEHRWKKRGISLMPMSYEHESLPYFRYTVHVTVFAHDGSVAVAHGGVEMGQGVNTKVAQVVANTLGIPIELVKIRETDSFVGSNSSYSGGSYTSDLCTDAAHKACLKLKERLDKQREKVKVKTQKDPNWKELLAHCLYEDIDLTQRYWTDLREAPETVFICGATCIEVEVDVLTGQFVILRADIVEDCGRSLNPYVDVGQIEGAFVMGLGLFSSESVKIDESTGAKLSCGTWDYKPMTAVDIPADFRVTLLPNLNNQSGALRSKATGEPPLCMAYSLVMALRQAIASARADMGNNDWFQMDTPLTVEKVHLLCNTKLSNFSI